MNKEYTCSVFLMILGDALQPDAVSKELDMIPNQSWIKDEKHDWGGWKKYISPEYENEYLEEQLQYWRDNLSQKKDNIQILKTKGLYCALDIFIITVSSASIIISEELQKEISELGVELRISIQAHE